MMNHIMGGHWSRGVSLCGTVSQVSLKVSVCWMYSCEWASLWVHTEMKTWQLSVWIERCLSWG